MAKPKTLLGKLRYIGNEPYIYRGSRRIILAAADELERLQEEVEQLKIEVNAAEEARYE